MPLQQTLRKPIEYRGIEFYGGNEFDVRIFPADENEGVFFDTKNGIVKARLGNASQSRSSILLQEGRARVIHVEHILATLFAYGIDNARIQLERIPTRSFRYLSNLRLATNIEVVPTSNDREFTLCNKIEGAGIVEQNERRKVLNLKRDCYFGKLDFESVKKGLIVQAITIYPIPGEETVTLDINAETYIYCLARSRPYVKHVPSWVPRWFASLGASLAYPSFGIGHGFSPETVFMPTRSLDSWREQEIIPAEIAHHTIVDRLGAISLLDGRLDETIVYTKFSGHANDIATLKELEQDELKIVD